MSTLDEMLVPAEAGVDEDVLASTEVEVPPEEPEAHRGTILGVASHVSERGSTSFRVSLQSVDTGRTDEMDVWLPRLFVENIHVDPATLPNEEGNRQHTSYSIGVSNSKKDATIQSLRAIAAKAGRKPQGAKPTTLAEYVQAHNDLLSGLEVVYTRTPDRPKEGDDPKFAGRLRAKRVLSQDDAFKPKALRKYRRMWEAA